MKFTFKHTNINVTNLDRSIKFYEDALGLSVVSRFKAPDESFELAFMGDGETAFQLELTWLENHPQRYELEDNEIHTAFGVENMGAALAKHKAMGCVCFENTMLGIYFIEDPDGYWMEIVPGA